MNDAKLYSKSNALQRKATLDCLNEFTKKFEWKNHANIIDIGCGDGSTTTQILVRYLPEDFKLLVGADISKNMVQFARKNYRGELTSFVRMDIESPLPQELVEYFDHVFSFFALHWIKKQKEAFSNIYHLLSVEGSCLLLFVGHSDVYDAYRMLTSGTKWRAHSKDVERLISPYHDTQDPKKQLQGILEEIGFRNIHVRNNETSFTFVNLDDFQNHIRAINTCDIPLENWREFFKDYLEMLSSLSTVELHNDEAFSLTFKYTQLVVMASK